MCGIIAIARRRTSRETPSAQTVLDLLSSAAEAMPSSSTPDLADRLMATAAALTEVEIDDVDGIDLAHLVVVEALEHIVGDGLAHAEEHAMEIAGLAVVLQLDEDEFLVLVFAEDVHGVDLVRCVVLVAL